MNVIAVDLADGTANSSVFKIIEPREIPFSLFGITGGSLALEFWSYSQGEWTAFTSVEAFTADEDFTLLLGRGVYRFAGTSLTGNPSIEGDALVLSSDQASEYA